MNLYTYGDADRAVNVPSLRHAYNVVSQREKISLPPLEEITVGTSNDGNFTLAIVAYNGRDPIGHRRVLMVGQGAAKRNPNDAFNRETGTTLAAIRALRQLGGIYEARS